MSDLLATPVQFLPRQSRKISAIPGNRAKLSVTGWIDIMVVMLALFLIAAIVMGLSVATSGFPEMVVQQQAAAHLNPVHVSGTNVALQPMSQLWSLGTHSDHLLPELR